MNINNRMFTTRNTRHVLGVHLYFIDPSFLFFIYTVCHVPADLTESHKLNSNLCFKHIYFKIDLNLASVTACAIYLYNVGEIFKLDNINTGTIE